MRCMNQEEKARIREIWKTACSLYISYLDEYSEDAHGIFQLGHKAMGDLEMRFNYDPLACRLAQTLVDHACDMHKADRQMLLKPTIIVYRS